jgi:hypothetical protein
MDLLLIFAASKGEELHYAGMPVVRCTGYSARWHGSAQLPTRTCYVVGVLPLEQLGGGTRKCHTACIPQAADCHCQQGDTDRKPSISNHQQYPSPMQSHHCPPALSQHQHQLRHHATIAYSPCHCHDSRPLGTCRDTHSNSRHHLTCRYLTRDEILMHSSCSTHPHDSTNWCQHEGKKPAAAPCIVLLVLLVLVLVLLVLLVVLNKHTGPNLGPRQ